MMEEKVRRLRSMYNLREALDDEDSCEDDRMIREVDKLQDMKNSRYLFRSSKYRKTRTKFDLEDTISYESVNTNDEEFLFLFRVSCKSIYMLLKEMESKDAFVIKNNSCHQRPISFQLPSIS